MKSISTKINELIIGSTFFGTGGGGSPEVAKQLFGLIPEGKDLKLATLDEFEADAVFVTAFGVGPISENGNDVDAIRKSFSTLESYLGKPIAGIVPVEIGPLSVAMAAFVAAELDLPLLDADFVGGRSAPEVYLETITMFDVPRTPLAVANEAGDVSLLVESASPQSEEYFLRSFSEDKNSQNYTVGYPMTAAEIRESVELGTMEDAIRAGELVVAKETAALFEEFAVQEFFAGTIEKIEEKEEPGFVTSMVTVKGEEGTARVFIKNENLLLWVNDELKVTCPDMIMFMTDTAEPLYNLQLEPGLAVRIVAAPARPLWRTEKGKGLFGPSEFGYSDPAVLLD